MKPAPLRLLFVSLLFVAWLGYLAYQVQTRPLTPAGQPLVLSRPQLLVSQVDVLAEVIGPNDKVKVFTVLYDPGQTVKEGDEFRVANLEACRAPVRGGSPSPPDFTGPGRYLLPLRRRNDRFEVTPIPPSPGYQNVEVIHGRLWPSPDPGPPRIYPDTDEARAQYGRVSKPAPVPGP